MEVALKRNPHPPIFFPFLRLHPQHLERRRSGSGVINPGIIHPPPPPGANPAKRDWSESFPRAQRASPRPGGHLVHSSRRSSGLPRTGIFFRAEKSSRALLTSFLLGGERSLSLGAAGRAMPRSLGREQGRCGCPAGRARGEAGISALVPGVGSRWGRSPPQPTPPPLLLLLGWGLLSASAAAGKSGPAGEPRPPRAPPERGAHPSPTGSLSLSPLSPLTFPTPSRPPSCSASLQSIPHPPPTLSRVLTSTLTLNATLNPSRNLAGSGPAWGPGRQTTPPGAEGHPDRGFSCSSLPAPQVPGFSPINFPGALPPPPPPDSGWHTGPGGWRGMARPLPVSASAGSALPAPAHFLVNEARAPAGAFSRLRPSPPPQVSPSPGARG